MHRNRKIGAHINIFFPCMEAKRAGVSNSLALSSTSSGENWSQAGYYHDTDYTKLGRVHVHLEGGNLCDSDQDCLARCDKDGDGEVEGRLCTASTQQMLVREGGLYSNITENPLADYWHVIVPYCSSDTWAGTGRSEDTGYYFHGKHIFRSDCDLSVILSLSLVTLLSLSFCAGMSSTVSAITTTSSQPRTLSCQDRPSHITVSSPPQHSDFKISIFSFLASTVVKVDCADRSVPGSSAGGFGVGLNCDDVADWLTGANPHMTVRCLADAPDFIPWWVHTQHCPRQSQPSPLQR